MESIFLKNLLRKENRPLLAVVLAVFLFQLIFFAYFIFDGRKGREEAGLRREAQQSETKFAIQEEKPVQKVDGVDSPGAPQLQITATDPKISALINKVFKHIFLPSGNVQVETVVKPDELRKVNPVFYQMAKAGDQILVYSDRAILYDPVADQVLDVIHITK